jgi:hypothetical protein
METHYTGYDASKYHPNLLLKLELDAGYLGREARGGSCLRS